MVKINYKLSTLFALCAVLSTGCAQDTTNPSSAKPFDLIEPQPTSEEETTFELKSEYAPGEGCSRKKEALHDDLLRCA